MPVKKIPRHAEATFETLCAGSGVTCNKATEDERGWDYFVQFPRGSVPGLPLDMAPSAEKCLVQVKSAVGSFRGVRVKLSNASEFALTDLPAFIVLFLYESKDRDLKSVHVLHFWESEIARTLKRLRELDAKQKRALQRYFITFRLKDMISVQRDALISLLESSINSHTPTYSDKKRRILEGVGFDKAPVVGNIDFAEGVTLEEIIDMQIGLLDRVAAARFTARSQRFGIAAGNPLFEGAGEISMRSHPRDCKLFVSSEASGREISLPSLLYGPALPRIPLELMKFRAVAPFVEVVCSAATSSMEFTGQWKGDVPYSLSEISTVLDLMHIFASGNANFRLMAGQDLIFGGSGPVTQSFEVHPYFKIADAFVKLLNQTVKPHDVPTEFRITLEDLAGRAQSIAEFNALATKETIAASCKITRIDLAYKGPGHVFYYWVVELPKFIVYALVRRKMDFSLDLEMKGKTPLSLGAVENIRVRILRGSLEETQKTIIDEVEKRAAELKDVPILILSNLERRAR